MLIMEKDHYINLVYGDYDVKPMTIDVDNTVVPLIENAEGGIDGYI